MIGEGVVGVSSPGSMDEVGGYYIARFPSGKAVGLDDVDAGTVGLKPASSRVGE